MKTKYSFKPIGLQPSQNKSLNIVSWVLGLLLILKSLELFSSVDLTTESEFYPVFFESALYIISGVAMLLLAWGVIKKQKWVRTSLYVVFVANALFFFYSLFLVSSWGDAGFSLVGAVLLWYYLTQTKNFHRGRRRVLLQLFTILTLLPATIFMFLSVVFQDETLKDDTSLLLQPVPLLAEEENIYIKLTDLGTELPESIERATQLINDYPDEWNQAEANTLLVDLQPFITTYIDSAQSNYQCPTTVNNFSLATEVCQLNLLRDYAWLMQFAAITEVERGNTKLALDYAMAPIQVGKTMTQSDNVSWLEYLVGLASLNIGLDTIDLLANQEFISSQTSRQEIAERLSDKNIPLDSTGTPLKRSYMELKTSLETLPSVQHYFYHPNRTQNELAFFMSKTIEQNTSNCISSGGQTSKLTDELNDYLKELQSNALNPTQPNIIGRILLSVSLSTLPEMNKAVCSINSRISEHTDSQ